MSILKSLSIVASSKPRNDPVWFRRDMVFPNSMQWAVKQIRENMTAVAPSDIT